MTKKSYTLTRIVIAFTLAIIFSVSLSIQNYIIPVLAMVTAMILLMDMRKKVDEIISDEMDYHTAGISSRYSITAYCLVAALLSFYFMAERGSNPAYEAIAMTLSYSVVAIMLANGIIFRFLRKKSYAHKN